MKLQLQNLYGAPYAPGETWPHSDLSPDPEGAKLAYFVPVGLWLRADSPEDARSLAYDLIDSLENADTGESGHIKGGFTMEHSYQAAAS
jgi:hypothetical protein